MQVLRCYLANPKPVNFDNNFHIQPKLAFNGRLTPPEIKKKEYLMGLISYCQVKIQTLSGQISRAKTPFTKEKYQVALTKINRLLELSQKQLEKLSKIEKD